MKKLGKNRKVSINTIEYYYCDCIGCYCYCSCSCGSVCTALCGGVSMLDASQNSNAAVDISENVYWPEADEDEAEVFDIMLT